MNILIFLIIRLIIKNPIISKTLKLKIQKSSNLFRDLKSISPLYGNSNKLFYYYTNLYIGEKKEKQTYIIDTGSSITTSPCSLCETCGKHLNSPFQISNNEILQCNNTKCKIAYNRNCYKNDKCEFYLFYSEGSSLQGYFIDKIIHFEDNLNENNNISIPIGCTLKETNLFVTQLADGIMGLGNKKNSFSSLLKYYGIIKKDIFSICLGKENGYFSIEEINNRNHYENIKYTKFDKDEDHYYIKIKNIEIYDIRIKVEISAFIDSGSTLTFMPRDLVEVIINKIKEICNKKKYINKCGKHSYNDYSLYCFEFNNQDEINYSIDNIFPDIIFNINNDLNFFWTPKNYFIQVSDNMICLGFKYSNKFLLGSTWMKEYDIIFNKENFSIGFAASNCNEEVNLNDKQNWEKYRKEREDKLREEVLGKDKEKDKDKDKDKEKDKEEDKEKDKEEDKEKDKEKEEEKDKEKDKDKDKDKEKDKDKDKEKEEEKEEEEEEKEEEDDKNIKEEKDKRKRKEKKEKGKKNDNYNIYIYIGIGIIILISLIIIIIKKQRNKISQKIKEFNFTKILNEEIEMEKGINKIIESPLTT